ncbi:MAG: hypothetical protein DA408_17050 [Bacteroidetes bacterium]|nr:MAG: hypothetical protein C7N36_17960 [Bacteroidota bacterium]PTM10000.1 MAG: hypothetical protein DA408_17050 [Bacteroidota bacterium]
MKTLVTYFLQGLFYITPISVTGYALFWLFTKLDQLLGLSFPGVGILIILVVVTLIGFIGSFFIKLPFFIYLEHQLESVPLIKPIYTSVKDMLKAIVGQKQGFNRPVLVKMGNDTELRRMGFVTDEGMKLMGTDQPLITVYMPFSISVSGQLFLVPPHYLQPVPGKPAEIMKYIMAGGVTSLGEEQPAPPLK